MATIDVDLPEKMKQYLAELVAAGKVSDAKQAHPLLKKKFGRSLTVGEVYRIVKAERPAEAKPMTSPPEPQPATRKRKVARSKPKVEKPSARSSRAKPAAQASRQEMKAYLIEQVRAGNVSAPKDAHALLKAKFGRSMSFGEMGPILGANRPGGKRPAAKKRGTPKRGQPAGREPAARSSTAASRSRNGATFAIVAPGQDPILAGSRREVIDEVGSLISRGTDSSVIEVFRRVPVRITTSYDIGL